tara:strand:- start:701 stop:1375 length:675 start_codon:yes stop_codon:yes gene_type:complete
MGFVDSKVSVAILVIVLIAELILLVLASVGNWWCTSDVIGNVPIPPNMTICGKLYDLGDPIDGAGDAYTDATGVFSGPYWNYTEMRAQYDEVGVDVGNATFAVLLTSALLVLLYFTVLAFNLIDEHRSGACCGNSRTVKHVLYLVMSVLTTVFQLAAWSMFYHNVGLIVVKSPAVIFGPGFYLTVAASCLSLYTLPYSILTICYVTDVYAVLPQRSRNLGLNNF